MFFSVFANSHELGSSKFDVLAPLQLSEKWSNTKSKRVVVDFAFGM